MNKFYNIDDIIKNSSKILITSHINPDGDTLGTMCALHSAIYENFKKNADMFITSKVPFAYRDLPFIEKAKSNYDNSLVYDLVISVDVAAKDRMGNSQILFDKAKQTINIDHHKTNPNYANINIVEGGSASAGLVLYKYMKQNNWKLTKEIAECLYVSILTDTGGFKYENTSAEAVKVAGELIELGVNPNQIYKSVYETKTKDFIMFQANALSKAKFSKDNKIAYTTIYKKDLETYKSAEDFTEGLVERLRVIDEVEVSFLVKEIDSKLSKISMRSKNIDVAEICATYGGGGHTYAAGCIIKASVENAAKILTGLIEERLCKNI